MIRRTPAALLVLAFAACTPTAKRPTQDDFKDQERAIVMAVGVQDTTQLKNGQWALYSVRSDDSSASLSTRIAVVNVEGGHFWIENRSVTPSGPGGRPRTLVSKYQIDASAKPLQIWIGEMPTPRPVKLYPGEDANGKPIPPIKPPTPDPSAKVEIAQERITIATTGKSFDCTRLTSRATYKDGRQTTLVTWCCPDVPFSAVHNGKSYGGVVRRTYGGHTLELAAMGTDAVPELSIPEK